LAVAACVASRPSLRELRSRWSGRLTRPAATATQLLTTWLSGPPPVNFVPDGRAV